MKKVKKNIDKYVRGQVEHHNRTFSVSMKVAKRKKK